jgi:transcriptional regulator with XRE-family HTH domain
MPLPPRATAYTLADIIRKIFARQGTSLSRISLVSRTITPYNRLQNIPRNLYSSLRIRRFSPNLYQIFALSVLTGYRFADWLAVFGFSLNDVPRFQAAFPALRTVELNAQAFQPGSLISWFSETRAPDFSAPIMPLSQWLALTTPSLQAVTEGSASGYRYAKIGSQDAFAFPQLVPGSVVRIAGFSRSSKFRQFGPKSKKKLFLVEHSNGLVCAPLCRSANRTFVLCSRQLPYAPVELQDGRDALVFGVADFEIRPLENFEMPTVPADLGRFWTPLPLKQTARGADVGEILRKARVRAGISFRQASQRTRIISKELGDARYYCAPGSLSDYETQKLLPRHVHKLLSICAVYFASVTEILEAAGVDPKKAGTAAIPTELLNIAPAGDKAASNPSHLFRELERRLGELPYFLHNSLASLFGLRNISVRDIFWTGGIRESIHPSLADALFVVVDRKRKNPRPALSCPKWAQPIYIVQRRDGSYLCGFCTLQNETLILRSCFAGVPKLLRLRNQVDAEVVGKVVGMARQLR